MKALSTVLITALVSAQLADAHQDDLGDVYPEVRVEDGKFAVYFTNNGEKKSYRSILNADGKVVSERKPVEKIPRLENPQWAVGEGLDTVVRFSGKRAFFTIPHSAGGTPPAVIKFTPDGEREEIELDWGGHDIHLVHTAAATDDGFAIIASGKPPQEHRDRYPFTFFQFSKTGELQHAKEIGAPTRVYFFPSQSQLLVHEGHAYVAWMRILHAGRAIAETGLVLSRFNLKNGEMSMAEVTPDGGHWNTKPSIGAIGDRLLIAFHYRLPRLPTDGIEGVARIKARSVSLKELFVAKK